MTSASMGAWEAAKPVGGASALVTFICVLCTLPTHKLTINMQRHTLQMKHGRSGHAVTVFNGEMYVLGGEDSKGALLATGRFNQQSISILCVFVTKRSHFYVRVGRRGLQGGVAGHR
jgi:hypothetical protein